MTDQADKPVEPTKPVHIGTLIRNLREAAGLTRTQLQEQTKLSVASITSAECGRHRPSAWSLRKLLKSPAMAALPESAAQAGLTMNVGADDAGPDANPKPDGSL